MGIVGYSTNDVHVEERGNNDDDGSDQPRGRVKGKGKEQVVITVGIINGNYFRGCVGLGFGKCRH